MGLFHNAGYHGMYECMGRLAYITYIRYNEGMKGLECNKSRGASDAAKTTAVSSLF
jgi:hypothetical protein